MSRITGALQRTLSGALQALPDRVLRLLSGHTAPTVRDGQTLAADVQLMLAIVRLIGHRSLDTLSVSDARGDIRHAASLAGPGEPVAHVEQLRIPGPAGPIGARLYVPGRTPPPRTLVVYYHGGGWVVGDLDTHDGICRFFANAVPARVLAVDYRLAPEHRFPAAVDDAVAAFRWALVQAEAVGADPEKIVVVGDSAGGNLAAVVSLACARDGTTGPAAQVLIYPATDLLDRHPSYRLFREGFFLTAAEMEWYIAHYLPNRDAARDPRASPLLAPDLSGLPPALVLTAGFDPLRDEGEAYAARLEEAGVQVWRRRFPGLVHGFANMTSASRTSRAAMLEAVSALQGRLQAR